MQALLAIMAAGAGRFFGVRYMAKKNDQMVMAQTIYGEARGEVRAGMEAVASVIMNRYDTGYRGKTTITGVCLDRWQFSAWNANDPNHIKIAVLEPGQGNAVFDIAYDIAGQAMAGNLYDRTLGARHDKSTYASAFWADPNKVSAQIGGHVFYRGIA